MKVPPPDEPTAQPTPPLEPDPLEPDPFEPDPFEPDPLSAETYLLTAVGTQALAFPAAWISEILVVEPTQILAVPFYMPAVIGLFNHHGKVVPLISAQEVLALNLTDRLTDREPTLAQDRAYGALSAVCLNSQIASLAGISIVVDRVLHSCERQQLPEAAAASHLQASSVQLFQADFIPEALWQLRQP
jgi:chemotaxis signal transduction protein